MSRRRSLCARATRRAAFIALVAGCALQIPPAPSAVAAHPAPAGPTVSGSAEERGRAIYLRGTSSAGRPLDAVIGAGMTVVPASSLPCVNCHGPEGRGRPEGGVAPSDLRWISLVRPYEVTTPSGRRHPGYTERLFGRAVTMGVDSAGNRLDDAMPRFRLSRADLDDLVAYVKTLGSEPDPGVSDAVIRLGALSAAGGPDSGSGQSVRGVLEAFFEEQNRRGGIYGRRIELRWADLPITRGTPEAQEESVRAFLDREQPFALLGVSLGSDEDRIAALLEERHTPLVGAVSPHAALGSPVPRYLFYLSSSPALPARAAAELRGEPRPLASAQGLSREHLTALAGAKLLVEGLKRAGRDLRREGLVEALEGVRDFQTGLMPPISYGKNRRVGAWVRSGAPVERR